MLISNKLLVLAFLTLQGCSSPTGLELQQQLTESLNSSRNSTPIDDPTSGKRHTVHAIAHGWELAISWFEGGLMRKVSWQNRDGGFSFEIPLKKRRSPWTNTQAGVTQTLHGPYQPSFRLRDDSESWAVVMSHEQMDFPTDNDLIAMLRWPYYADSAAWALSKEGMFAELRVGRSPTGNSLGITLHRFTVRGLPPAPNTLAPFIRGSITTKSEQPGTGQPATDPVDEPEGGDKPQPEAEGRSR